MSLLGALGDVLPFFLDAKVLLMMVVATLVGVSVGIIPGLGGIFALAVLLPFTFGMEPMLGLILLLSMHSSIATGGAVTSILINAPGSSNNAATCLDGYPMTQQGRASEALTCAAVSSGLGGALGAVVLLLTIPFIRPMVLAIGPPEVFALILIGLVMIAYVGEGSTVKSIVAGLIGMVFSFVGSDPTTGVDRFNFGNLYLIGGIGLVPVVIGMFALAEMLTLIKTKRRIVEVHKIVGIREGLAAGIKQCFKNWWLLIRASAIGVFVGFVPGVGGEVAGFISYGHALQTSKHPEKFGTGLPEGVIAPEAANNAKEGGALIPTLAFGVPGSGGMAVLLGAMLVLGVAPGPNMFTTDLNITVAIVVALVLSNIIAAAFCLGLAGPLSRLININPNILVPAVVVISCAGAYCIDYSFESVLLALFFAFLGYEMKKFGYSRATLTIGLVLGHLAEINFHLTKDVFGHTFIFRPITVGLLVMVLIFIALAVRNKRKGGSGNVEKA